MGPGFTIFGINLFCPFTKYMKLAAIVVTYYPEVDVPKNISSCIDYVELLIIWENTPLRDRLYYNIDLPEYSDKIIYLGTDNNEGLGYAYNVGTKYAKDLGFTHIMTLDQDTSFVGFEGFKSNIEKESDKKVGIFIPPYNAGGVYDFSPLECSVGIQSGSVFSIEMLDEIGLFRDDFFIDCIDFEINFRARKFGYKCVTYGGCNMIHTIGSCRTASILGFQFSPPDYSPLRRFYQARNTLFLMKEYPGEYSFKKKIRHFVYTIKAIVKIILGETNKIDKILAILKGLTYGIFSINKPYK